MAKNEHDIKNSDLFIEYKNSKSIELRNKIFEKYQYLAEFISRKYNNKGVEFEDICQVANIGLIYAIERYDIDKGFEFTSFAAPTIIGEIRRYFRDKGWSVRVPRRIQENSKKINTVVNEIIMKSGKSPTIKEISRITGYAEEEVLEAMEVGKLFVSQSLNYIFENDSDNKELRFEELIKDENDSYLDFENNEFLKESIKALNELEKEIIINRFFDNLTQSEIAKRLNISQMTVSRIEKKALEKIKKLATE